MLFKKELEKILFYWCIFLRWYSLPSSAFHATAIMHSSRKNNDTLPAPSAKDITIPGNFSSKTNMRFDSNFIKVFVKKFPAFNALYRDLYTFYFNRKFSFAWYDEKGLIEPASNILNRIQKYFFRRFKRYFALPAWVYCADGKWRNRQRRRTAHKHRADAYCTIFYLCKKSLVWH